MGRSGGPNKNSPKAVFRHGHTSGDHRRQSELRGLTQARSEQALLFKMGTLCKALSRAQKAHRVEQSADPRLDQTE